MNPRSRRFLGVLFGVGVSILFGWTPPARSQAGEDGFASVTRTGGGLDFAVPELSLSLAAASLGEAASKEGRAGWALEAALGFTVDPETCLLGFHVDRELAGPVSGGALLQIGIAGDDFVIAPALDVSVGFPLPFEGLEMFCPNFLFGLGFLYRDEQTRRGWRDEIGFLMTFGAGIEYRVSEEVAVGTRFLFNVLPDEVRGEHFLFAWEVLGVRYRF